MICWKKFAGATVAIGLSWSSLVQAETASIASSEPILFKDVRQFFSNYCLDCHDADTHKGGVDLELYGPDTVVFQHRKIFETIKHMLEAREMPPQKKTQPSDEERVRIIHFIGGELAKLDCTGEINPGRVTARRLNRAEYNNTIRDLVGIDFNPAADFPIDEVGYGFDNIGDVLSLPPILLEKYLSAAEQIATNAIVVGPVDEPPPPLPETHQRIMICQPEGGNTTDCAKVILRNFAERAYRRPVTEAEVDRLVRFVDLVQSKKGSFEEGIQLAVQAVLVSPHFLYRWELDSSGEEAGIIQPLDDYSLASRLSYFLWSSMPDEELFSLARQGTLRDPAVLEAQAKRMLQSSKARALVDNFAGQWLQIRNLDNVAPDPNLFPEFDDALRRAMKAETELFFEAILKEDRSIIEFLTADFTFVNERLAKHYGIEDVKGDQFQRVNLDQKTQRGGILTQASILTLTSHSTRTSPVNRGKWILEQILGAPPPPPPPDAGELEETEEAITSGSLRQRFEQHRSKAECATCHSKLDPLGFAFEHFDAIGAWRDLDGQFPIDPSGVLPTGESFEGPEGLKAILASQETFIQTVSEKMLTFALGRGLEYYDKCTVDDLGDALKRNDYRFSVLVTEIVRSAPFTRKTGKGQIQ
jgi:mono/diheme cytochrome c family protein